MEKFDGKRMSTLSSSQVKQIAGRAGRFGTEYHSGLVTTYVRSNLEVLNICSEARITQIYIFSLHEEDLVLLRDLMSQGSENIKVIQVVL